MNEPAIDKDLEHKQNAAFRAKEIFTDLVAPLADKDNTTTVSASSPLKLHHAKVQIQCANENLEYLRGIKNYLDQLELSSVVFAEPADNRNVSRLVISLQEPDIDKILDGIEERSKTTKLGKQAKEAIAQYLDAYTKSHSADLEGLKYQLDYNWQSVNIDVNNVAMVSKSTAVLSIPLVDQLNACGFTITRDGTNGCGKNDPLYTCIGVSTQTPDIGKAIAALNTKTQELRAAAPKLTVVVDEVEHNAPAQNPAQGAIKT